VKKEKKRQRKENESRGMSRGWRAEAKGGTSEALGGNQPHELASILEASGRRTALHLARIRQTSILSLLPKKVKTTMLAQIYHAKIVLFML